METNWTEYIIAVLTGLAACIPLVVKLVEYVKKAVKERNWKQLLQLIMDLMEEAEKNFDDGATRKEWVLAMVQASSETINYNIDINAVSELIDRLCAMSNTVNAPAYDRIETAERIL